MPTVAELSARISVIGMDKFSRDLASGGKSVDNFGNSLTNVGAKMSLAITAPIALMAREVIKAGSSFESAFAGVRKTVDATEPELAHLRHAFRNLALEIPITANEIAKIGEAAGSLGIRNENIVGFTKVMAELGAATNMSSDQAATALARLANITQMPQENFDRLGATVVDLGNKLASTESEITEMGLRLAGAGEQVKLTEAQILGFAGALSSVGIEAEAGGTAFSRVMLNMQSAVKTGGAELAGFAKVAGQSSAQFRQAFETDAAGAIIAFVEGLKRMSDQGANLLPVLGSLELGEIRVRDALLRTANAGDLLRNSVELGTKAWNENTALTKEAAERYKTFDSQIQLVKNRLSDIAITLFDTLRPSLVSSLDGVKNLITGLKDLDPTIIKTAAALAGAFALSGPAALAIGQFAKMIPFLLSPTGAAITAAIAGAVAITTAYATNFGELKTATDRFVKNFGGSFKGISDIFGVSLDAAQLWGNAIVQHMDEIMTRASMVVIALKTLAEVAVAVFAGQFRLAINLAATGMAKWGDEQVALAERSDTRWKNMAEAAKGHWLKAMREMGKEGKTEFEAGLKGLAQIAGTAAAAAGRKAREGWDSETKKSPFFIIHDMMNAIAFAQNLAPALGKAASDTGKAMKDGFNLSSVEKAFIEFPQTLQDQVAPKLKNAGKQMVKDMREAFNDLLAIINDWSQAVGPKIQITAELLARLTKQNRADLVSLGKEYRETKEAVDAYSVALALNAPKADTVTAALRKLLDADKKYREEIKATSHEVGGLSDKMAIAATAAIHWGRVMLEAAEHLRVTAEQAKIAAANWGRIFQEAADHVKVMGGLVNAVGPAMAGVIETILKATGNLKTKVIEDFTRISSGVLDVVGALPGKLGDKLRGAVGTVQDWVNRIDTILKGLHKIWDKIPDGLGKALESVIGIFKSKKVDVEAMLDDVFGPVISETGAAGGKSGTSFVDGFLSKIPAIAGALGTFFGTRGQGLITGVLGGAAAGAQIGSMIAPGIGTAIGAIGGGILGLFGIGGGPSKEEQKQAAKEAALNFERMVADTNSAILDVLSKGADLLKGLENFTDVPAKAIRRFFKQIKEVLLRAVDLAKEFKVEASQHAKAIAENLSPVVDFLLNSLGLVRAFEQPINEVSDESVNVLMRSISKIEAGYEKVIEELDTKVVKRGAKIANKLSESFSFIGSIPALIKSVLETPQATDEEINTALDSNFSFARKVVDRFEDLVSEFARYALTRTAKAAEKFKVITDSAASVFALLKSFGDHTPIEDAALNSVLTDFSKILTWEDQLIEMGQAGLSKADTLQDVISRMVASLKAGLGNLTGITTGLSAAGLSGASLSPASLTLAPSALSLAPKSGGSPVTNIHTVNIGNQTFTSTNGDNPIVDRLLEFMEELTGVPQRVASMS